MGLHGVSPPDRGRASPRSGWPRGRGQRFPGGGYRQRTSTDGAVTHEPVRRVLERTDGGTAGRRVPVIADVGPREGDSAFEPVVVGRHPISCRPCFRPPWALRSGVTGTGFGSRGRRGGGPRGDRGGGGHRHRVRHPRTTRRRATGGPWGRGSPAARTRRAGRATAPRQGVRATARPGAPGR